jgi:hypothetical protein
MIASRSSQKKLSLKVIFISFLFDQYLIGIKMPIWHTKVSKQQHRPYDSNSNHSDDESEQMNGSCGSAKIKIGRGRFLKKTGYSTV